MNYGTMRRKIVHRASISIENRLSPVTTTLLRVTHDVNCLPRSALYRTQCHQVKNRRPHKDACSDLKSRIFITEGLDLRKRKDR
jgi:hypothetical protein